MPDINDVCGQKFKNVARFLTESEILALTRVSTSAASCNEALNSPMIVSKMYSADFYQNLKFAATFSELI